MASRAQGLHRVVVTVLSLLTLGCAGWGVHGAMHSPMFLLQVVEFTDFPENAPVDAQTISHLAAVPVGQVNLFNLDLKPVEERILSHAWIREVRLEKKFPQTLSVTVVFRQPQALAQGESGALSYVDVDGRAFGQVDLNVQLDLPVISSKDGSHYVEAIELIKRWELSELSKSAQLSLLQWDPERGFRALVAYDLERSTQPGSPSLAPGRTFIELGQDLDERNGKSQFERLSQVFKYLSANRVLARQVWADAGKKIVVKAARGS